MTSFQYLQPKSNKLWSSKYLNKNLKPMSRDSLTKRQDSKVQIKDKTEHLPIWKIEMNLQIRKNLLYQSVNSLNLSCPLSRLLWNLTWQLCKKKYQDQLKHTTNSLKSLNKLNRVHYNKIYQIYKISKQTIATVMSL